MNIQLQWITSWVDWKKNSRGNNALVMDGLDDSSG